MGEMIRTPPRGPLGAGDRGTRRPSEASDQEAMLWSDPWDRLEAGETPMRGSAKVSPQGEEGTRAGHPRQAQGIPHHRPGAHGSEGSGLAAAGREAPSAGSVVPAPSPQSSSYGPVIREHGSPPKAQALPGASGHSPWTLVRQLLCIYKHRTMVVSRGCVSPWTMGDFRPSSRRGNPGWVAGPGLSPLPVSTPDALTGTALPRKSQKQRSYLTPTLGRGVAFRFLPNTRKTTLRVTTATFPGLPATVCLKGSPRDDNGHPRAPGLPCETDLRSG